MIKYKKIILPLIYIILELAYFKKYGYKTRNSMEG